MTDDILKPPKQSKSDVAYTLVKVGLTAIPYLGGPTAELFQNIIQPPLERRRIAWMTSVGEKLQSLESHLFKIDNLKANEVFISAVMHASQIVLRTHQKEKIEALRNAIINVAKGEAPEDSVQHLFLNLVDSLTVLHIQILKLFQAPLAPDTGFGALSHVLELNISELRGNRELSDLLWRDLTAHGLVSTVDLHVTMSCDGLSQKRTTGLGDAFLKFISEN